MVLDRAAWRNAEHRRQWDALKIQAQPLWELPVAKIDTGAVMRVLEPVWQERTKTAARLRGRIEAVLDYATARNWQSSDPNPARWRGHLDQLLPSPRKLQPVRHLAAADWRDIPALWAELTPRNDLAALAIRLVLATTVRRDEARAARWDEIDLPARVWTIPAARTKTNVEHRVPISDAALDVLRALAALRRDALLFPGAVSGRPLGCDLVHTSVVLFRAASSSRSDCSARGRGSRRHIGVASALVATEEAESNERIEEVARRARMNAEVSAHRIKLEWRVSGRRKDAEPGAVQHPRFSER